MKLAGPCLGQGDEFRNGLHTDIRPCGEAAYQIADAAGLDYYAETSVGEFILGTRLDASRAGSRFEAPR